MCRIFHLAVVRSLGLEGSGCTMWGTGWNWSSLLGSRDIRLVRCCAGPMRSFVWIFSRYWSSVLRISLTAYRAFPCCSICTIFCPYSTWSAGWWNMLFGSIVLGSPMGMTVMLLWPCVFIRIICGNTCSFTLSLFILSCSRFWVIAAGDWGPLLLLSLLHHWKHSCKGQQDRACLCGSVCIPVDSWDNDQNRVSRFTHIIQKFMLLLWIILTTRHFVFNMQSKSQFWPLQKHGNGSPPKESEYIP